MPEDLSKNLIIISDGLFEYEVTLVELDPERPYNEDGSSPNWLILLDKELTRYAIEKIKTLASYRIVGIETYRFNDQLPELAVNSAIGDADGYIPIDELKKWLEFNKRSTQSGRAEVALMQSGQSKLIIAAPETSKSDAIALQGLLSSKMMSADLLIFDARGDNLPGIEDVEDRLAHYDTLIVVASNESTDIGFLIGLALSANHQVVAICKKGTFLAPVIQGITDNRFGVLYYSDLEEIVTYLEELTK